ncbi:MAG TPA: alpha/beta hydrolase [Gemmatimonadales bacterium]|nr:alpha/beta hydrolase [Gemmatimonadales bacterium]
MTAATLAVPVPPAQAPAPSAALTDGWFVTSDSVRLHYLTGGSGPTIIFVPGWTMPAEIWEPQLAYFARAHHVVALDPRSQGRSQHATEGNFVDRRAQDIHELVRHLGEHHVVLIGWSLGVAELLAMIERFGTDDIAGLVLVDGLVWVTPHASTAAFFDSALVGMLRDRRTFTSAFVRGMYHTHQDAQYLERITRAALSTPTPTAYTLLASAYAVGRRDWRPALRRVDRPVMFVGTGFTRETADTVRARVPGARVEILEHAGHALFVDDADRFNRILESFLQGLR